MPSQDKDPIEEMIEALDKGDVAAFEKALDAEVTSDPMDALGSIDYLLLTIVPEMHDCSPHPAAACAMFTRMVESLRDLIPLADNECERGYIKRTLTVAEAVSDWNDNFECVAIENALAEINGNSPIEGRDSALETRASRPNAISPSALPPPLRL